MVDMHTHSYISDGTLSPKELILEAKKNNLNAVALTDHDTVDGLKESEIIANTNKIEFIKGIEYSCNIGNNEIHILGYFLNLEDENFIKRTNALLYSRNIRNKYMIEKLNKLGININYEEILTKMKGSVMGRLHIANEMINKGYSKSIEEIFDKYLSKRGKAYVEREDCSPYKVLEILKDNNAFVSLAHPKLISDNIDFIEKLIKDLKNKGLDAIEVYHPSANISETNLLKKISKKYGLLNTGGSDFHGENKKNINIGKCYISMEEYDKIRNYIGR